VPRSYFGDVVKGLSYLQRPSWHSRRQHADDSRIQAQASNCVNRTRRDQAVSPTLESARKALETKPAVST